MLKGPNALLFGRGGAGGVLSRVTKKSVLDSEFLHTGASPDTFGAASLQLARNILLNDNVAQRFNALAETLENYRDFFDGDRVGVKFRLSEKTVSDLSYELLDHEQFIDRGIVTGANGRPVEANCGIVFGDLEQDTSSLEAHLVIGFTSAVSQKIPS